MLNSLTFNEFVFLVEKLKKYEGFKTTIKESIFRVCKEDRSRDHGKIIVSSACYNKIVNNGRNRMTLDYITIKLNITYSLENDNTILFFKRA